MGIGWSADVSPMSRRSSSRLMVKTSYHLPFVLFSGGVGDRPHPTWSLFSRGTPFLVRHIEEKRRAVAFLRQDLLALHRHFPTFFAVLASHCERQRPEPLVRDF